MTGDAAGFDFVRLERDLIRAARKALAEARRAHPRETICAFSLYSDEGAMTVCPAIDFASARDQRIAQTPEYVSDMTFAPAEWALESVGAEDEFDAICKRLSDHVGAHPRQFGRFRRALFATCVDALAQLRERRAVRASCLLVFAVSDATPSPSLDGARFVRLNPGHPATAYRAWLRASC